MVFGRTRSGANAAESSRFNMREMFKLITEKLDQIQATQNSILTNFTEKCLTQNREIEELRRLMREAEDQFKAQELNELWNALGHTELTHSAGGRFNSDAIEAQTSASRGKTGLIQPPEKPKFNGTVADSFERTISPELDTLQPAADQDIEMTMPDGGNSDRENVAPAPPAPLPHTESPVPEASVFLLAAESNMSKERPVRKMRPTRGKSVRGRGGGRVPVRASVDDESSSDRVVEAPKIVPTRGGFGKARRAGPLMSGRVQPQVESPPAVHPIEGESESDSGAEEQVPSTSGFVAVNQRAVKTPARNTAPLLASIGPGMPSASGSASNKKIPPPSAKVIARDRKLPENLPEEPFWFTADAIKAITGTRPGKIVAQVTKENVLHYEYYIVFTPDLHFNPPKAIGDTCELVDLHNAEGELLASRYPIFKKMDRSHFAFYGEYKVGGRKMVPLSIWQNSDPVVKKKWAEKFITTAWGSKMLLDKGLRTPGEIRNFTLRDIMEFFNRDDESRALRLSATSFEFVDFDRKLYDKMVAVAESLSNGGIPAPSVPHSSTRVPKQTTVVSTVDVDDNDESPPIGTRKRRRVGAESPAQASGPDRERRFPERARRATQGAQYSILHLSRGGEHESTPSSSNQWRVESRKKREPSPAEASADEGDDGSSDGMEIQGADSD
ncbi:hypothetical protein C7212DRAFT_281099 [Tuber magnatum]|uniref:DUF6697 domain-containing protein n=1 Tax=Tuber magnatum TaxID=42249 RepID=A0A317SL25_9PEZI|nr:hypothetical protein C7212DRAFT_281099 [Tuber magnatum]